MKPLLILIVSLVFASIAVCQQLPGNNPEHVISRMLQTGAYEGHDDKVIGPLGDAAAVIVTRVAAGKALTSHEVDMVLVVLRAAFADPGAVPNAPDREPRTCMFVLRYLDSSSENVELKGRIADTKRYVQERYQKSTQPASPARP